VRFEVGILGAYGGVGRVAALQLARLKLGPLCVAGPQLPRACALASELGCEATASRVDLYDQSALGEFVRSCRVVVNCAGPSHGVMDRVAVAALAAGCDYVDPAGEAAQAAIERLPWAAAGRRAVLSAGMLPGLSALLPRALARSLPRPPHRLTAYCGGRDRFTVRGASDYLASLSNGFGEPLAMFRAGARVSRGLQPQRDVALSGFSPNVTAYPYLSTESERLARDLGLHELRWYNVFDGAHTLAAIGRVQASAQGAGAAEELARASELDLFGSRSYQCLLLEFEMVEPAQTERFIIRGESANALSGATVALAVRGILDAEVPPGCGLAEAVLDPERSWQRLQECGVAVLINDAPAGHGMKEMAGVDSNLAFEDGGI
jgi:hypothetical protein